MTEQLDPKFIRIIDRAASRIRKQDRDAFRKFVFDVLRGQLAPTNTIVRHACGQAFLKYGRKI
jgi:hypothetical protein